MSATVTEPQTPMLRLASLLLAMTRHIGVLLALPLAGAVAGVAYTLATRGYTATSAIMPQVPSTGGSRIAGVAAQLGISVGGGTSGETLEFYARLLESKEVLSDLARSTFHVAKAPGARDSLSGTLLDLLGIEAETESSRMLAAVTSLRSAVNVRPDIEAGLLTVTTTAPSAGLAEAMNARLLDLVNAFNSERRRSQAASERAFVETRLQQARSELDSAEDALERFLTVNRSYRDSPRLLFLFGQLERRVALRQSVYAGLAQAYEQARIEEVRNTPVVTVVDSPAGTAIPSAGAKRSAILGLLLGGALAVIWIAVVEFVRREREEEPSLYGRLSAVWRERVARFRPRRG